MYMTFSRPFKETFKKNIFSPLKTECEDPICLPNLLSQQVIKLLFPGLFLCSLHTFWSQRVLKVVLVRKEWSE